MFLWFRWKQDWFRVSHSDWLIALVRYGYIKQEQMKLWKCLNRMHVSDRDITSLSSEIAMSISHSACGVSTWACVCVCPSAHSYCKTAAQNSYVHGLPVTFPMCCGYAWRVSETERRRGKARVRKTGNHFSLWGQWSGEACRWNPIFLWLSPLKIFHLSVPASWRLPPS